MIHLGGGSIRDIFHFRACANFSRFFVGTAGMSPFEWQKDVTKKISQPNLGWRHGTFCFSRTNRQTVSPFSNHFLVRLPSKNSPRDNSLLGTSIALPAVWVQLRSLPRWQIVLHAALLAFVIKIKRVLGLSYLDHFIMRVQLHLQFDYLKIWNFRWTYMIITDSSISPLFPMSFLRIVFVFTGTIASSRPYQPLSGEDCQIFYLPQIRYDKLTFHHIKFYMKVLRCDRQRSCTPTTPKSSGMSYQQPDNVTRHLYLRARTYHHQF